MSLADGAAERSSSAAHLTKALRFQRRRRGSYELSNPRTDEVEEDPPLICKSITNRIVSEVLSRWLMRWRLAMCT